MVAAEGEPSSEELWEGVVVEDVSSYTLNLLARPACLALLTSSMSSGLDTSGGRALCKYL